MSSGESPAQRRAAAQPAKSDPGVSPGDFYEQIAKGLAECSEDALSQAACGGMIDPDQVIEWVERAVRLILYQRDRAALRSEVPVLGQRLRELVEAVDRDQDLEPQQVVEGFVQRLVSIRGLLALDVEAAFEGDPAASSFEEIVLAYPSLLALSIYRIAHELHRLGVPLLPRIMSEHAHGRTGIDIHPGARIGKRFFIDHGTGVVIGETAQVGDGVRIYQGVTLGAASLRNSSGLRGAKRHPTIEDEVTIYAGATILGGQTTIGCSSVIGGNVWLTASVPPGSRVVAEPARHLVHQDEAADRDESVALTWEV
jgi:serine O-acetyltransferase